MAAEVSGGGGSIEVCPWLKSMPVAPEYHPTFAEFQDPIAYIFKIEKEASKYGICKIVPPVAAAQKKTIVANLNKSLLARSNDPESGPTFTTRQQQVGFCPRKHRPVKKPVWQSGERYTLSEFEFKAKNFERNYLKRYAKKVLNPLEMETLYWNATVDKPFSVEYANDMAGSAFVVKKKSGGKKSETALTVGDTEWNMRGVSRGNASLLKFMKEEIPGVTSPMVYVAMMFSWFAWHVEDHDFHSLNYLHLGSAKTWYGVPRDAAVAFEEVVREHGYAGEINPLVTFATLGEKTTVMSPEVLLSVGVPCCRLVQNAGDFVVTFPRAYHSGFSHGFNCGEASNIATPEWLRIAKEAAIRRASINCPPMVSHFQLLYDLALSLCSRVPRNIVTEPRSSRLKDKKKSEGEMLVKELFFQDMMQNNEMLHVLGEGSSIVLLSQNSLSSSVFSNSQAGQRSAAKSRLFPSLCSPDLEFMTTKYNGRDDFMIERMQGMKRARDYAVSGKVSLCSGNTDKMDSDMKKTSQGLFSCATCGILCFACVAIVQPTEAAVHHLMSADCSKCDDWGVSGSECNYVSDTNAPNMYPYSVLELIKSQDGLYNVPISSGRQIQNFDEGSVGTLSNNKESTRKSPSSLGLLALAYGNSSDSEAEADIRENEHACDNIESEINCRSVAVQKFSDSDANFGLSKATYSNRDTRSFDCPVEFRADNCTENSLTHRFRHQTRLRNDTLHCTEEDSSRLHVFCLQHAMQVRKRLSSIGGAHVFLVCHPDYPKLESQARKVAEELESNHPWNKVLFREATEDDKDMIQSALDSENAVHGNGDWAVKMGINLFYSANLSRSPLYCKQMPYNDVIYSAFGRKSPTSTTIESEGKSGRQRKIVVAGKWCGKVWMSNQAHPLLVKNDLEEQEEFGVGSGIKPDFTYERRLGGKTSRKRKEDSLEMQNENAPRQDFVLRYSRKKNNGKRGPKQLKKEILPADENLEDSSEEFPFSNSWKQNESKRGLDDSSEEFQPGNSRKKMKVTHGTPMRLKNRGPAAENSEESSEETPLTHSWKQIKSKARRTKRETPTPQEKPASIEKQFGPLSDDDDLAGGPVTRLRTRTKKPCQDLSSKSGKVKPAPKQQEKGRSTRKAPVNKLSACNSSKARIREEEGKYQCDMEGCAMSFGTKHELTLHKHNICPLKGCGKKFFSHKYLVQHRRVHEDDRPLKCPWKGCKMTFKWAWARTEHIRVHTGARPYVCTQAGCGQTFRFVSDFSRHKRKTGHTPKKSRG